MNKTFTSLAMGTLIMLSTPGMTANGATSPGTAPGTPATAAAYRPGEVIVKFRTSTKTTISTMSSGRVSATGSSDLSSLMSKFGVSKADRLMPLTGNTPTAISSRTTINSTGSATDDDMSKLYCLKFDESQAAGVEQFVEELQTLDEVEFAEPNYIVRTLDVANPSAFVKEPMYSMQWGIPAIGLDKLWKAPLTSGRKSVIAILDTGVDTEHPDLKDNLWVNTAELDGTTGSDDDNNGFADDIHGYDFVNQTGRLRDNNGHGTHCAGIAAATGNNGIGIAGANPDALIMAVTVMQSDGTGDVATIIKGIDYAAANGADVISMSFGGYSNSLAEEQALAKAYQKAVLVAAAGNDNLCIYPHLCDINKKQGAAMFPAAYSFVLGVQASGQSGALASFSNYDEDGPVTSTFADLFNYELMAPGQGIISTFPGGQYRQLNGTSMACPLVAGAISRLLQAKEYASKEELFGDLIHASNGNLDIYAAYQISDKDRQPTLSLVTYRIDDSENGDGDKRPDAGETIYIYPTLRNQWGNARNITYSIRLADTEDPEIAEFIDTDGEHTVMDLSSYASAEAATPFGIKISPDCTDGRRIRFVLTATCDNITEPLEQEIVLTAENGVELGGVLREDMTLTPDKNYIVTSLLGVPAGRTLTILPGTTIKFKYKTGISVANGGKVIANGEPGNMVTFTTTDDCDYNRITGLRICSAVDTISYVNFLNVSIEDAQIAPIGYYKHCILSGVGDGFFCGYPDPTFEKTTIIDSQHGRGSDFGSILIDCNIVRFKSGDDIQLDHCFNSNTFSNGVYHSTTGYPYYSWWTYEIAGSFIKKTPTFFSPEKPNYLGSGRQDIVQPTVLDIKNSASESFGEYDLSNMLTRPSTEAHGIVWKVVVNGYDAQDEYEMLPPLGVGRHKFEVYFNRPMNTEKAPMIAMGVREPYTQTAIGEDGSWNETGDIYTAYLTISGRDSYDGVNTIYVADAEDDEFFPIPLENSRFRVDVQSAGSMSAGFTAEPGLGKVTLTWENPEENVDDLLGYNLYRYTVDSENTVSDTLRINTSLLDTEEYTDFDVTPGTTYCYYYKVMTTALTENSPSKTVATTPLTSIKGDANGTMDVDVADIVTEVSYMLGQNPQPFIYEAADVNSDEEIDVLDIVGTVNIITGTAQPETSVASVAGYYVDNGTLYVKSPVDLAGVQIRLTDTDGTTTISPLESLQGFETMGVDGNDNDYTFLAFSLSGKTLKAGTHAIATLGDGTLSALVLSDAYGRNIPTVPEETMGIEEITADRITPAYPSPFTTEINVPLSITGEGTHHASITLTSLSGQTVTVHNGNYGSGEHTVQLRTESIGRGFYLLTISIDGVMKNTQKVIKL